MTHADQISHTESLVLTVWSEIFEVPAVDIGIDDEVMQFGGSIELIKVVLCIQETFGPQLPMVDLLENATVRGMATVIDRYSQGPS